MSRFVAITADPDFEARARQAASRLRGTFHGIVANFLPPGPDDVLRMLSGDLVEVIAV